MPKPTICLKTAAAAAAASLVLTGCATGSDVYERTGITPALAPAADSGAYAVDLDDREPDIIGESEINADARHGEKQAEKTTTVTVTATAVAVIPQSAMNQAMQGQLLPPAKQTGSEPATVANPEMTWTKDPADEKVGKTKADKDRGEKKKIITAYDTPKFTIADDDGECLDEVAEYSRTGDHPAITYRGVPRDEVTVTYLTNGTIAGEKTVTLKKGVTSLQIVDTTINADDLSDISVTVKRGDRPAQSCVIDD